MPLHIKGGIMEPLYMKLARKKLSIREVTRRTGVTSPTISKMLDEIADDLKVRSLRQVAEGLGLRVRIEFEEVDGG